MFPPLTAPTRVQHFNRGYGYAVSGVSGTIAAALAQDSVVFALLCDPQTALNNAPRDKLNIYVDRLRIAVTTINAFTTPVTAGRRVGVYRASGGVAATGGTALPVVRKDTAAPASVCLDARIAAAAALGVAGITRESAPIMTLDLSHVGGAGARQDWVLELAAPMNNPLAINAGELLVVSNPVAMDAGGTFQLSVDELHWIEAKQVDK
jgi:hypothetical protein